MSYNSRYGGGGRRLPPKIERMISLKVDNLTYRTTEDDLKKVFERCGEVGDVYIPRDRVTQESRGFGFVRFYEKRDAEDALDAMDGRMLDGRELRVQMARYGRPNSPHRYGGRRSNFRRKSYSYRRSRSYDRRRSYSRSRSRSRSKSRRRSYSRSRSYSSKSNASRRSRSYSKPSASNHDRSRSASSA